MILQFAKLLKIITSIILICSSSTVYAETAIVKDGDTIKIGERNIRFYGIDAPESKQKCYYWNGESWDCGLAAKHLLEELIDRKDVNCIKQTIDLYKREVAICYVEDQELNRLMVQKGLAIAYREYSKKYISDELIAKKQFIGIWNSSFMEPAQWRRYSKFIAQKVKNIK